MLKENGAQENSRIKKIRNLIASRKTKGNLIMKRRVKRKKIQMRKKLIFYLFFSKCICFRDKLYLC